MNFRCVCSSAVLCLLVVDLRAADWPQFRHDAQRSAASTEALPSTLHLQWVRELATPRPAFPNEIRLLYDGSYEPVVLDKTMFVPSMVTDSVTALETDTGKVRWRFFADAPVRFAPVAWEGRVFFVSDDGYLYCVSAGDGKLLWKFRGLPAGKLDRLVIGNGRLIALRPARGGPVLKDGVIYFGAGIWLGDGIFVHALNATTGKPLWSNDDSNLLKQANLDHGVKSYAGLTPQGYLAALGNKLVVPCGAQLPGFLDLKTGKLEPYTMGWGGRVGLPKGSWLVTGSGKYLAHSGDLYDITRPNDERFKKSRGRTDYKGRLYPGGYTRLLIDPANRRALGEFTQPVFSNDTLYQSEAAGIRAYDLTKVEVKERSVNRRKDQFPDKWTATLARKWALSSKVKVHIKAGSRIYTAAAGIVEAVDLPPAGGKPTVSWRTKIAGTPSRMLAADGKLFVVTKEGRIYSFGKTPVSKPVVHADHNDKQQPVDDRWTSTAKRLLADSKTTGGYALLLGAGSGRLAEELVRQSKLIVIAVDADAERVQRLRERFHRAGLYGTRVTVLSGDPLKVPFPPYIANLVVLEDAASLGKSFDTASARRIYRTLRPYGGMAHLEIAVEESARVAKEFRAAKLPKSLVRVTNTSVTMTRNGSLPGAADWSHTGANAANAGASQDRFLKAPLGILWFDGSVRWHRKPGSATIRVAGGRVFIMSRDLLAVDVFTGRHLWKTPVPRPSARAPQFVAAEDGIYIPLGRKILVLDPVAGEKLHEIQIPEKLNKETTAGWSRLRVHDDYLVATIGRHFVCLDRKSKKLLWSFRAQHDRLSVAVGGGRAFCAEIRKINRKPKPGEAKSKPRTQAFDLKTGNVLWTLSDASELRYSPDHQLVITTQAIYFASDGKLMRKHKLPFSVAGDTLISTTADRLTTLNLLSGSQLSRDLKWFRRGCTDLRSCANLATTRFQGNAAYVDLATRRITPLWNVRSGCNNNLIPANGVLNVPNLTGGCECNYTPTSLGFVPLSELELHDKASTRQ